MQQFAVKAGAIPGVTAARDSAGGNIVDFLSRRGGNLEQEIIKKGMSKAEAQKAASKSYMNNEQLM